MGAGRRAAYSSFSACRLHSDRLVRLWLSWGLGGSLFHLPRRADALALLLRGRIAQVLARLVRQLLEAGDHVGVLRRDVGLLADVLLQVVQGQPGVGLLVRAGLAAGA